MVSQRAVRVGPVDSRRNRVYPRAVLLAIWLMAGAIFGLVCGLLAIRRNRSAAGWFIMGLLIGPIALVWLLVQRRRDEPAFL
jgi:hypothetical protein